MRNRSNLKLNSFFLLFFLKSCIFLNCISFSQWITTIRYTCAWMDMNRSCGAKQWDICSIDKKKTLTFFLSLSLFSFVKKKRSIQTNDLLYRIEPLIRIQCLNWPYFYYLMFYRVNFIYLSMFANCHTLYFFFVCIVSKRCRMDDDWTYYPLGSNRNCVYSLINIKKWMFYLKSK
jgi:hypothetical protein